MLRETRLVLLTVALAGFAFPGHAAEPSRKPSGPMPSRLYVVVSPSDEPGPSAVARFDLDAEGRPWQVETYETGGLGGAFFSPQGVVVRPQGDLLFVSNNESDNVSVFRVLSDGSLDPVGSPFPVGGKPIYLAVHPSGEFLYVGEYTSGALHVLGVDGAGALAELQVVPGVGPFEMVVDPGGRFLFVASFAGIRVFAVSGTGTLAEVNGSPFPTPGVRTHNVELDSSGERLFAQDLDTGIAVYEVDPSGTLDLVNGSPFFVSSFANAMALTQDDKFLYVSSPFQATLDAFRVLGGGRLAEIHGSPFAGDYVAVDVLNPVGTRRLYEFGADTRRISVFQIPPNGRLSQAAYSPIDVTDGEGRVPNGAVFLRGPAPVAGRP